MWSDAVVFEDKEFTDAIKANYPEFLNRKLHSFTGYAVGQAKKYGIKGSRYKELIEFNGRFYTERALKDKTKLSTIFHLFSNYFSSKKTKYLKMTTAEGPKTGKGENIISYVEILGKKFSGDVTFGYFLERVKNMEDEFGNRSKASAEGVDWKALSHSVRVLLEVEELLDTGFITFPLKDLVYIKSVKEDKEDIEDVMEAINTLLDLVNYKLETSTLPEESNRELMDQIELKTIKGK